ncbi:tryptophan synthase subunit alpha [Desulfobotulus sp. H1]|uniref:Tryptophan synthase alpha chain n=1 Tax=Desulfobotulus pelophilus TaxID=2823377 RepID=A0ABT3NAD0_9BACT|nr:tryptophan synthase subunit alpha [Desulfobotulus pelophilus]MCW7754126.1 tryptophan synthase subunit alpha [Desulfobotulus pelophilus]
MNRIRNMFEQCRNRKEAALIGFVSAGDPDMETSRKIIFSMLDHGMDLLEIGIPFSDPTADGPVIQLASQRALKAGVSLGTALKMVKEIREHYPTPIVLFSYLNPILAHGPEKFCKDAAAAGADGVLVVDMPLEESGELLPFLEASGLVSIPLVAPTTPEDRMEIICRNAKGFIYLVSMTGVTGSGGLHTDGAGAMARKVRAVSPVPVALGFGISEASQVAALVPHADGIVIGSAFVRVIGETADREKIPAILGKMTKEFKKACTHSR